ncbi:AMP-dependent synthetase and ligase [Candidatus Nitrosoglobus terrae]|uniref:AMP-dependent synthetase and ligase n=1 Tax=Candidatus Nitrosoglobus terrae TaxID=1630141 RepID=A0A1Q2SLL6_9GAMM|nr:AMP-binding protein [Candidatus Nitrosoglobus terrae]BAW79999.1 AMP-dependent synthetase and ligase [Candidatus Nitrosoglobus terrae]
MNKMDKYAKIIAALLRFLFKICYRIQIKDFEYYQQAGERILIIANHISSLDPLLLAEFLPRDTVYIIPPQTAKNPWLQHLHIFPLDPTAPDAAETLLEYLNQYHRVVIFPEGRIRTTRIMMKIYPRIGWAAYKSGAMVLPVRIEGAEDTLFFSVQKKHRRWFPIITMTLLPPRQFILPTSLSSRELHEQTESLLLEAMTEISFTNDRYRRPLFQSLLDARSIYGRRFQIMEDVDRQPITYDQLIQRAFLLGALIAKDTQPREFIGVLLPTALSTTVLFFALHSHNRVPAMLNFTMGTAGLFAAIETSSIRIVYTSQRFIKAAELQAVAEALVDKVQLIYLEDLRQRIKPLQLLRAMVQSYFARVTYQRLAPKVTADDPAVVLFTSGSEGTPKGVVLSHANLLANIQQVTSRIEFTQEDLLFNALPLFHAFGLTMGMILPLLSGIRLFLYPSPLHYRVIPELIYRTNATILFGTNTFLTGYAQQAHCYDFYRMRYVIAGAEKLQESTRSIWAEKFGIRIFEGYGVTETGPVLAYNTPLENRPGTVGRLLPQIAYYIEPVPGIKSGGRLIVRGPNIMLGYLLAQTQRQLQPPRTSRGEGWYDTGDIVDIDKDGYLIIYGRAKRFAKIAGEMISLAVIEELASKTWPNASHAVIILPDPKRGEEPVLLTEQTDAERRPLLAQAKTEGLSEIHVPRRILIVEKIPLLASGKIDYTSAQQWVKQKLLSPDKDKDND